MVYHHVYQAYILRRRMIRLYQHLGNNRWFQKYHHSKGWYKLPTSDKPAQDALRRVKQQFNVRMEAIRDALGSKECFLEIMGENPLRPEFTNSEFTKNEAKAWFFLFWYALKPNTLFHPKIPEELIQGGIVQ